MSLKDYVALWGFSTLWNFSLIGFVTFSHYEVCRQLWGLLLIGFVAISVCIIIISGLMFQTATCSLVGQFLTLQLKDPANTAAVSLAVKQLRQAVSSYAT